MKLLTTHAGPSRWMLVDYCERCLSETSTYRYVCEKGDDLCAAHRAEQDAAEAGDPADEDEPDCPECGGRNMIAPDRRCPTCAGGLVTTWRCDDD